MTSEAAVELSVDVKRPPALMAVLLWAAGIACVGFTTCYAYHIGL
ncbi:MAG TPA: hypothetical protein VHA35_01465 [Dongiaceae bacterium]|nr:hypothetical protein [Dongiaceae bacterium]